MMFSPLVLVLALSATTQQPPASAAAPSPAPARTSRRAAAAPVSYASSDEAIAAGLSAFRKKRFQQAQAAFQAAVDQDPSSAAATFYLAYTVYKIAEPKRPFHPEKKRAAELFAKAYELDPAFKPQWRPRT